MRSAPSSMSLRYGTLPRRSGNRAIEAGEALTRAAFTSLRYVAQHSQDPDSSSEAKSTAVAIYRDARIALTDLVDAVREN